jgi:hypothetical protein
MKRYSCSPCTIFRMAGKIDDVPEELLCLEAESRARRRGCPLPRCCLGFLMAIDNRREKNVEGLRGGGVC